MIFYIFFLKDNNNFPDDILSRSSYLEGKFTLPTHPEWFDNLPNSPRGHDGAATDRRDFSLIMAVIETTSASCFSCQRPSGLHGALFNPTLLDCGDQSTNALLCFIFKVSSFYTRRENF